MTKELKKMFHKKKEESEGGCLRREPSSANKRSRKLSDNTYVSRWTGLLKQSVETFFGNSRLHKIVSVRESFVIGIHDSFPLCIFECVVAKLIEV